ncbi:hypothetical protein [Streptomyces sp. NPDC006879]|uniref:Rv1733c family protein n=1 Tax=Streptomyces sp. NPDC006879 TaxID=3364767 RepID=UPI00368ECA38
MPEAHSAEGRPRRLFGRRSNELRRAADRARGRWLAALRVLPLVAVLCGIAIAMVVWNAEQRSAQAQALHRHRIEARTVGQADRALPVRFNGPQVATARATWEYPPSQRHVDTVVVTAGTPAGGKVLVWVDDTGQQAAGPRPDAEVATTAVAAGAAAFGVLVLGGGTAVWSGLRRVERSSLAAWGRDWETRGADLVRSLAQGTRQRGRMRPPHPCDPPRPTPRPHWGRRLVHIGFVSIPPWVVASDPYVRLSHGR